MKKIIFVVFLFAALVAASGCVGQPSGLPQGQQPQAVTDCGTDLVCFIDAAQVCRDSKVSHTETIDVWGMEATTTSFYEIRGNGENGCALYLRTEKQDIKFSDEFVQQALQGGRTQGEIDEQERIANEAADLLGGKDGTCKFSSNANLASFMTKIKEGRFIGGISCTLTAAGETECISTGDWSLAECEGEIFMPVQPATAAQPQQQDECTSAADCDDGSTCTIDRCTGIPKKCAYESVISCINADNCCPSGCAYQTDSDCPVADECSTNADCSDNLASTKDVCSGTPKKCSHTKITSCAGGDNYCPSGCKHSADSDCPAIDECNTDSDCYDNNTETRDSCSGTPKVCSNIRYECMIDNECDDNNACTYNFCYQRECRYDPIAECYSGDGCCPSGCTNALDSDCAPSACGIYSLITQINILKGISSSIVVYGYGDANSVSWAVENTSIATVSPSTGAATMATGQNAGTTTITATDTAVGANCTASILVQVYS